MKNRLIYSTNTELHHLSPASLKIRGYYVENKSKKKYMRSSTHKPIAINTYGCVMYIHKKNHIFETLSFSHQLNVCRFIIFSLPTPLLFSLSLINAQINICVCVLLVSVHSENESAVLCYTLDSHLVYNGGRKKKEKKRMYLSCLSIFAVRIITIVSFNFSVSVVSFFFFYCFYRKTGTTMSL